MFPADSTSTTVRLCVTVTDVLGAQRVLTLLIGRSYAFTRFTADGTGDGDWVVTFDVLAAAEQVDLLAARLHRCPSVLTVGVGSAPALAATG